MKQMLDIRKEDVDMEHRPYKKLELRKHFNALKFIKHKHEEVKKYILSGLKTMHQKAIPTTYAIIHFYMKYMGMDQNYILWCRCRKKSIVVTW